MFSYYVRLALASMRRTPVLSALMVLALGLGIGAFMTTFTVYYLMSGDPIPHKSDVLYAVQLDNWDPNEAPTESAKDVQPQLTYRDGQNLMNAETPATRQAHMYASNVVVVPEGAEAPFDENVRATYQTFFGMFDVPFLYGRPWETHDDADHASVAVIGRELNDQLFGGENSVGKSIQFGVLCFQVSRVLALRLFRLFALGDVAHDGTVNLSSSTFQEERESSTGNMLLSCLSPFISMVPLENLPAECNRFIRWRYVSLSGSVVKRISGWPNASFSR